ncbi:T9SS type A sorting domain-containing protein [Hymenobacter saemangeumensis]|uniref:T9SS type A sorting domain-containing protein n=1 Tax=Hymenobacter saemangeumensis TaxID=1084522 RepID=UPI003CD0A1C5
MNLFPNPAKEEVTIEPRENLRYEWVKVLDLQGRIVEERQSKEAVGVTSFNVKAIPNGLYQVQLFDGKRLSTQRLVKE